MGKQAFQKKFRSITTDNGPEFLEYELLTRSIYGGQRFQVYYCHSYAAWEKGSNENHNRMIRRFFPKGTDFSKITKKRIAELQDIGLEDTGRGGVTQDISSMKQISNGSGVHLCDRAPPRPRPRRRGPSGHLLCFFFARIQRRDGLDTPSILVCWVFCWSFKISSSVIISPAFMDFLRLPTQARVL